MVVGELMLVCYSSTKDCQLEGEGNIIKPWWILLLGGLAFLIGTGLLAGAVHISMLFLGRVFLGIGVGFANQVSTSLCYWFAIQHAGMLNLWCCAAGVFLFGAVSDFVACRLCRCT